MACVFDLGSFRALDGAWKEGSSLGPVLDGGDARILRYCCFYRTLLLLLCLLLLHTMDTYPSRPGAGQANDRREGADGR